MGTRVHTSRLNRRCFLPLLTVPFVAASADQELAAHLASFDQVWQTIRDVYWDPGFGGVDWEDARRRFRPKVEGGGNRTEVRRAISEMLGLLGQSHFAVIPAEAFAAGKASGNGQPPFDIRIVSGHALVTRGSDGIRTGWELETVRTENIAALIESIRGLPPIVQLRVIRDRLSGAPGDRIPAVFRQDPGKTWAREIPLAAPELEAAGIGMLPAQPLEIEAREIGRCGYLRFNWFLDPVQLIPVVQKAVERFRTARGFVLDLRGNAGGMGLLAPGIAGFFVAEQGLRLGTMRMRNATLEFVVNPRSPSYPGLLAILIDEASASTSEILAAGMRDLKRARLFGSRTAGAALPSWIERLPNGDGFQYAAADYVSVSGVRLEGAGVHPDVAAPHTRELLLAGTDAALQAAVDWIQHS